MINQDKMVNAGPKPYDPLLMFKILILQRYYNLGDEQIEYQILADILFFVSTKTDLPLAPMRDDDAIRSIS
ncbi:MAG: transposase [Cytophagales bacterium]|nr:transposase [Cytophagales bacterium]